jgi:hypothetical protein
MTTWGKEQSHHCTKRKTYGGALCFTGVALVLHPLLPGGRTQGGILGLPGRDLPSWGKACSYPPIKYPPEHQIVHLELPATHEPLMIALERLLVACIFNSRLPPLLVD